MSAESLKLGSLVPGGLPAGQGKTLMAGESVSAQRPEFMPFNATGSGKKLDDRRMENDPVLEFLNSIDPPRPHPAAPWTVPNPNPKAAAALGYHDLGTDKETMLTSRTLLSPVPFEDRQY
jgi:hypothetical protein